MSDITFSTVPYPPSLDHMAIHLSPATQAFTGSALVDAGVSEEFAEFWEISSWVSVITSCKSNKVVPRRTWDERRLSG